MSVCVRSLFAWCEGVAATCVPVWSSHSSEQRSRIYLNDDSHSIFYSSKCSRAEASMAVSADSAHKGIQERFTAAVNVIRGLPKNGKQTCHLNYTWFSIVLLFNETTSADLIERQINERKTNENKTNKTHVFVWCCAVNVRISKHLTTQNTRIIYNDCPHFNSSLEKLLKKIGSDPIAHVH